MSKPPQNDGERVVWMAVYAAAWSSVRCKLGEIAAHGLRGTMTPRDIAEIASNDADLALDELRRLAGFKESSAYAVIGDPAGCHHLCDYPAPMFGTEKEPCPKCGRYYLDG